MPLEVKAGISYDGKDYRIVCKPLGIDVEGDGDFDDMVEHLRSELKSHIEEEFHVSPESITLAAYNTSFSFEIDGPRNRKLSDFGEKDEGDEPRKKSRRYGKEEKEEETGE